MENLVARILLKNLVGRIEQRADGSFVLDGKLTQEEIEALNFALRLLEATPTTSVPATPAEPAPLPPIPPSGIPGNEAEAQDVPKSVPVDEVVSVSPPIDIDTSSLQLPAAPNDIRLCLDFGTAMSKATLVRDGEDDYDDEQITVLRLGVYGDDEEDEYMLISSVYIDNGGKLWFGKDAEEISARESDDGSRQRMDNIKRWLSEGMIDSPVGERFNPTRIRITYADVLLAYLTFLTWTVNKALDDADQPPGGYPRNLNRRFAMPCLSGATFREVSHRLSKYLGEAQVLADTFFQNLRNGVQLSEFTAAVAKLRELGKLEYAFVKESITEPLGVAGTLLSYYTEEPHHMMVMVIDVGAGTSDFSLYRMHIDPERDTSIAVEADGAAGGISEAGNHLDQALKGLILLNCGSSRDDPLFPNDNWFLDRNIRNYKETLFNEGSVYVSLPSGRSTELSLPQFLDSPGARKFEQALERKMREILTNLGADWIDLIGTPRVPYLTVALTGGGASLPMVRALAKRTIEINGKQIQIEAARDYPKWLQKDHPELEHDYPRIAVSLGGARKRMIQRGGAFRSTAGGQLGKLVYDDPKYLW